MKFHNCFFKGKSVEQYTSVPGKIKDSPTLTDIFKLHDRHQNRAVTRKDLTIEFNARP